MLSRHNGIVAVVFGLFAATAMAAERDAPAKPNVLIILADDLGYGDLSCYGAEDLRTPNIDGLVASGMRFDNFYANCPVCSPTRAALLTGRYQELVGVPGVIRTHPENNWGYLSADAVLLPSLLHQAGYHTTIVGKWHLGLESPNTPNERGFDYFHGFLGDMMDDYFHHRRHDINYMRENGKEIAPEGHATDLFTQWACDYIRSRQNESAPFMLYLAYNAPHTPIQPPQDWLDKVRKREPLIDPERAKLVALIEHLDAGIGEVLKTLRETEKYENALVVFSSDNGGQLNIGANNGPWRDGKGSMYEGGLRVPAVVAWPGVIAPSSRTEVVAATMDLFPTILEAAGVEHDGPVDGVSLLTTLKGGKQDLQRELYFCRREGGLAYNGLTIHALRQEDWKLVHNSPYGPMELYNLAEDPQEQHDLAQKNRPVFARLCASLRKQIQRGGAVPWQAPRK